MKDRKLPPDLKVFLRFLTVVARAISLQRDLGDPREGAERRALLRGHPPRPFEPDPVCTGGGRVRCI